MLFDFNFIINSVPSGCYRDYWLCSCFINKPSTLSNDKKSGGSKLVKERHYNTFKDTAGIFGFFIGSVDFGYKLNPISNTVSSGGIIPYIYQELGYTDQNGDMAIGFSGSIFVDQDNNIYGIHFASDFISHCWNRLYINQWRLKL